MRFNRLGHCDHGVDKDGDLSSIETSGEPVLGKSTGRFVFERKRNVGDQRYLSTPRSHEQRGGSAPWAAHGRNDNIGVENQPHIADDMILQMISQLGRNSLLETNSASSRIRYADLSCGNLMQHAAVGILLNALAAYAAIGVAAALAFVTIGVTHVQPASVSLGARILILPGAAALWPYVLARWLKAAR